MKLKIYHLLFFVLLFFVFPFKHSFSQEFEMPGYINDISSCDMDNDGSNDIIISCPYTDSIVILFNDGIGNFTLKYYNRLCGSFIPCGLIDSDSLPDIITGTSEGISFIKNLGQRNLSENQTIIETIGNLEVQVINDLNLDSLNDLMYTYTSGEYWGIFKNNGDLNFTNLIMQSGSSTTTPAVGLITDDSLPDVVLAYSAFNRTSVNINNENFNFTEVVLAQTMIGEAFVMNIDNQGTDDFAFANYYTKTIPLYKFIGNNQFELQSNFYAEGTYPVSSFLPADFNQDGYDDFIITRGDWWNSSDSLYIYFNDQNWSFYLNQILYIGEMNWYKSCSADLNGDAFPDIFMKGCNGSNILTLLWNDGDGNFSFENPVKIEETASNKCSISIYPNPFSTQIMIEINQHLSKDLTISISNIYGKLIKSFNLTKTETNNIQTLMWDGNDENFVHCSTGIYIITAKSNSFCVSKKIVKY